jgi:hypothetical protein
MFQIINIASACLIGVVILVCLVYRKKTYVLDKRYFKRRWNRIQKLCADKKTWCKAIICADALLDEALKRKHFKGKSTGERLVSAQRYLSSNDAVWFSHKLKNKIEEQELKKVTKKETIEALTSYRLALKDLGALGEERTDKSYAGK